MSEIRHVDNDSVIAADAADRIDAVGIFHRRFDPHVLPQDTSKHEGSSDTERYRASSSVCVWLRAGPSTSAAVPPRQPIQPRRTTTDVDTSEAKDRTTRSVLHDRMRLQCVVHV